LRIDFLIRDPRSHDSGVASAGYFLSSAGQLTMTWIGSGFGRSSPRIANLAHPAFADRADDFVDAEARAGSERHRYSGRSTENPHARYRRFIVCILWP
jgi:hypothetical protein